MKNSKMHKYIDQLLMGGKEDEAIPLIKAVWRKEKEQTEKEIGNRKYFKKNRGIRERQGSDTTKSNR